MNHQNIQQDHLTWEIELLPAFVFCTLRRRVFFISQTRPWSISFWVTGIMGSKIDYKCVWILQSFHKIFSSFPTGKRRKWKAKRCCWYRTVNRSLLRIGRCDNHIFTRREETTWEATTLSLEKSDVPWNDGSWYCHIYPFTHITLSDHTHTPCFSGGLIKIRLLLV